MADRHERDKTTFRPPPEVKAEAQNALTESGWTMNDVLVACLTWLSREPAAFLAALERHRPPAKRGRPRKPAD